MLNAQDSSLVMSCPSFSKLVPNTARNIKQPRHAWVVSQCESVCLLSQLLSNDCEKLLLVYPHHRFGFCGESTFIHIGLMLGWEWG